MKMNCVNFLGKLMSQTMLAIPLWELLVDKYKPKRIIELGTGNGAFSSYLKLLTISFDADFYTFDILELESNPIFRLIDLEDSYEQLNIFESKNEIANIIEYDGRTILFCDNGKKIDEFNIFSEYLKVGDIIGAHDWGKEISDENVLDSISKFNLKHIELDHNLETKSYSKFFIKE